MALTLRLNDQESDQLDRMMGIMEIGTASGAIKKMILSYERMAKELEGAKYNLAAMKEDRENIASLILEQKEAKYRVNSIQSKLSYWANK